jgi:nucleoside-diphosphate-sugar epimerase
MKVAITGAHSFTGRYVAELLLQKGFSIVNLTNHPNRPWKIHSPHIIDFPLSFEKEHLVNCLKGCDVLVQTYWVRFDDKLGVSRDTVTNNSKMLIDCAREAGVRKVVFTSHTQTSLDSPFPYIREKAKVEEYLKQSGLEWGIVKPCAIFGRTPEESILINNMAYLIKKFPFFPLPGDGNYHFQFVHAQDMAQLIVASLESGNNYEIDAVGPDNISFKQIVEECAKAFGTRCRPLTGINKRLVNLMTMPLNWYFEDILMDTHDLDLMATGLTCSHDPPTGKISLIEWVRQNK